MKLNLLRWALPLAWIVAGGAVLLFGPGCGIKVPPISLDCRILGCPSGFACQMDDTKPEAVYACVDVCVGKTPRCVEQSDVDCWAMGPEGTCKFFPKPEPPVCPEACPVGQQCTDPVAGCVPLPVAHEPVCKPATNCGCWVQPPGEDWKMLECQAPQVCGSDSVCKDPPPPACPEACPVGQQCTDPKVGCVAPPPPAPGGTCGLIGIELVASSCPGEQFAQENKRGTTALGVLSGTPSANLESLAAWFRSQGWCAIAGSEALFILRDDGKVEERHSVYFGDGSWTNSGSGKYIGCHTAPEGSIKAEACPPPLPSKDPSHLRINARPWMRDRCDATMVTVMTCDYCRAIGLGCYGADPPCSPLRCGCPMRSELSPYRGACERYAAGVTAWQTDPPGKEVIPVDGNPWQVRCDGCSRLRVCTEDLSVCSDWVDM